MAGFSSDLSNLFVVGTVILVLSIFVIIIGPKVFGKAFGILSIIGILAVIGVGISIPQVIEFFQQPTRTSTQAKSGFTPQQVNFIRTFSTEFTITWQTQSPVIGAIRYGRNPDQLDSAAAELDPSQNKSTHLVRVIDLKPGTTYYVEIISGGENFDNQGQPFSISLPNLNE